MTPLIDRLLPGRTARLNMLFDLSLLLLVLYGSGCEATERLTLVAVGVWFLAGAMMRNYDGWAYQRPRTFDAAMLSIVVMIVTSALAIMVALESGPSRLLVLVLVPLFCWPIALLVRLLVFRAVSRREAPIDEVLIVGTSALGRATADDLRRGGRRTVMGFLSFVGDAVDPRRQPSGRVLGDVQLLDETLRTTPVSEVFIAGNHSLHGEQMQAAVKICERYGVPFALPAFHLRFDRARPIAGRHVADGYLHYQSVDHKPYQMALKRLLDIFASGLALLLLSPVLLAVALGIKLSSKGPVLFKQQRSGLHGKTFAMLKFRSMVVDAEQLKEKLKQMNEQTGPVFKMKNDPRITGIGRFIRKYSIDELPQLVNVLRGDMSLVGPRPALPSEVAQYEPWQRRRLSVRPGITCIWQVSGRNQISFTEWMALDMQYIDRWSLLNDLHLLARTVPVVILGKGAS